MNLWQDKIRSIEPYVPGEQPTGNVIKLNTNECPYAPSPKIKEVLDNYSIDKLRLYPSFVCPQLKEALAKKYNVNENQIFLGNGSDEVLALSFLAFFNSKKPVLFPDITYSFYDVWCKLYNIDFEKIPLNDKFEINVNDYFKENGGIIIANPNAPTGIYMELDALEEIIKHNQDVIIIIDEAYIDFGGKSAIELINKYDNIVIVQTFSKSRALAGIRIGYVLTNPKLVDVLEAVKNSFNSYTLNSLSQVIGTVAVNDDQYLKDCCNKIISTRQRLVNALDQLGFETLPSMANFIFTKHKSINGSDIFKYLKKNNIYIRYFNKPRISDYLRITIGTDEQVDMLIEALTKYVK